MNSINDVEDVLIKEYSKTKEIPTSFYPSKASVKLPDGTIVGECLRKLFYEYTGEPVSDPLPIKSIYKMAIGNLIHTWFMSKLAEKVGGKIEEEVQYKDPDLEREIHGRIDHRREDGSITEVKSTFGQGFRFIPKPEHKLQARIYDFLTKHTAKFLELVYIARDSANRASFEVDSKGEDGLTYDAAKVRWVELEKRIKENKIPDRDFVLGKDWNCDYCQYKMTCWGATPPEEKKTNAKRKANDGNKSVPSTW